MATIKGRQVTESEIKRRVRILRRISKKFRPDDGYDLRDIDSWSGARKAAITKVWHEVEPFVTSSFKVYRPRKKANLNIVREATHQTDLPKWLTVAFVPVADARRPVRIQITKRGYVLKELTPKGNWLASYTVDFDMTELQRDPHNAFEQALEDYNANDMFVIMAGSHLTKFGGNKKETLRELHKWPEKYGADKHDPNDPSSHYFENWLFGVRYLGNIPKPEYWDYEDQIKAEQAARKKERLRRAKAKRRLKEQAAKRKQKAALKEAIELQSKRLQARFDRKLERELQKALKRKR